MNQAASQKILIGNLPPDVTTDELRSILTEAGVDDVQIGLNNEGDPNKVTAVLELAGIDRVTADKIAADIKGRVFRGRTLNAYVPLFL